MGEIIEDGVDEGEGGGGYDYLFVVEEIGEMVDEEEVDGGVYGLDSGGLVDVDGGIEVGVDEYFV